MDQGRKISVNFFNCVSPKLYTIKSIKDSLIRKITVIHKNHS